MNKIILKRISLFFFCLAPIGLVIGFSNTWTNFPSISIGGSSAVEPLSSALGNKYNDADVSVVAGGSSAGIKYAALSEKDIGNASTNPYSKVEEATIAKNGWDRGVWDTKQMKTVTIAWDAIAIVYKPPSDFKDDLIISNSNIVKLYEIFAGLTAVPLRDMNLNTPSNINFIPYARTGGASASGTASSFLTESSFTASKTIPSNINTILKSGQYGSHTTTTNESNIESWTRIKSDGKVGSIIYLSLGFVKKNIAEIERSGFKVALYQNEKPGSIPSNPIKNTENDKLGIDTYAWFSPLNSIFSLTAASPAVKEFMWWIFSDEQSESIISEYGFIPLNQNYKKTMLSNPLPAVDINLGNIQAKNNFLSSSDIKLEAERIDGDELWYGAPK
ncbi:MAG: substrate-binding domain-containing protein [Malacoplasma sp.]